MCHRCHVYRVHKYKSCPACGGRVNQGDDLTSGLVGAAVGAATDSAIIGGIAGTLVGGSLIGGVLGGIAGDMFDGVLGD